MRRGFVSKSKKIVVIIFFFFFVIGFVKLMRYYNYVRDMTGITPSVVAKLLFDGGATLQSTDDRTNILILGIAGGDHEGPDLTDTMIVASLQSKKKTVALLSLPRDIWSDTLKDKINSAYHYGEEKKKGGGMVLTKAIVEDVVGFPIHYTLVIDFSQFEQIITALGGIDVKVSASFIDTEYPIAGRENDLCNGDITYRCRYETIEFVKGVQHMDGAMALKYVRSRHAEGDEGTDFARSRRQQDVIVALKDKFLQSKPWFHPSLSLKLFQAVDTATDTTMTIGEQLTLGKLVMLVPSGSIKKISIEPLLIVPPTWMYGRYVLVPAEDYKTIHEFIQTELNK